MDISKLIEDAAKYAVIAVEKDTSGDKLSAIENYLKAVSLLEQSASRMNDRNKIEKFLAKANEYCHRAASLGLLTKFYF